ncbi:hypothetical protein B0G71_1167 [Paraburkholderia sp. BL27I4N3]|nr:hypothetical protein B0G71_1167 [Paraburkholderia sp. BL27I4N3]
MRRGEAWSSRPRRGKTPVDGPSQRAGATLRGASFGRPCHAAHCRPRFFYGHVMRSDLSLAFLIAGLISFISILFTPGVSGVTRAMKCYAARRVWDHNGPERQENLIANERPPVSSDDNCTYMPENATIKSVKHIGIALFDRFALCETASVIEVFQSANVLLSCDRGRAVRYKVCLLSTVGGCVASSSSVNVWTGSVDTPRHVELFPGAFRR